MREHLQGLTFGSSIDMLLCLGEEKRESTNEREGVDETLSGTLVLICWSGRLVFTGFRYVIIPPPPPPYVLAFLYLYFHLVLSVLHKGDVVCVLINLWWGKNNLMVAVETPVE